MTAVNEAALETVARNVSAARVAAGLSLDALAARAEVSKGALVALEGARGNPNLTTLVAHRRRARTLGVLADGGGERRSAVVVDADEVPPLWTGPSGGTARLLLTNSAPLAGRGLALASCIRVSGTRATRTRPASPRR